MDTASLLASIGIFSIFASMIGTLSLTIASIKIMGDIRDNIVLPDDLNETTGKLSTMMKIGIGISVIGGGFTSIILPKIWKYRISIFEAFVSTKTKV